MRRCFFRASLILAWTLIPLAVHAASGERSLDAYTNDDGSKPDGADSVRDDSSALRKALAAGPGIVRIGKGFYRCGDIRIPANVTLIGQGKATVLRSNGKPAIFRQEGVDDWAIRDLALDGAAAGDWRHRKDEGKTGLYVEASNGFEISGITVRNFAGAGIQLTRCKGYAGGRLTGITASGCHVGIRFDLRAEYLIATQLNCRLNVVGCIIHAGNTNISASNFCENIDGMLIEDKDNGSHGSITGCVFNHNLRHALWARKAENGMAITNSCFFYGTLKIQESIGINVTSSLVSCHVHTEGTGANRFAGNHIIPLDWRFTFAPADIVEANFTKAGPWTPLPKAK